MDLELIDDLYEAALAPARWPAFLVSVSRRFGARDTLIARVRDNVASLIGSSAHYEAVIARVLEKFDGANNERTRRLLAADYPGFLTDLDVFSRQEIATSPVYQDVLIPGGYGSATATAIQTPSGDFAVLNLERSVVEGPFSAEALTRLNALRPHLARAAFISHRLDMERARSVAQALQWLDLPAAVLDASGRAIAANDLMQALMPVRAQDTPARLALVHAPADKLLRAAIGTIGVRATVGAVRSIPVPAQADLPPLIFHVTPVRGAAHDFFSLAAAVVVVTPVVAKDAPAPRLIQGLFDLTPAEARLAAQIASGKQPREAAQVLGVTEETARTTLKRVLAKTGSSRQADLVGLLSGVTPK